MALTDTNICLETNHPAIASQLHLIWAWFQEFRRRRRQIAELRAVDPRILRDMAIDRSEVTSIVNTGASGRRRKYTNK